MARDGIEPPTHGASIHCSTDWATEPLTYTIIWYKRSMTDLNRRSSPWQGDEITTTPMDQFQWRIQGSNLWPSACKADALPTELILHKRGDALSSQGAIPQLLSARWSLTSVFGMGTGVSFKPSSPHWSVSGLKACAFKTKQYLSLTSNLPPFNLVKSSTD